MRTIGSLLFAALLAPACSSNDCDAPRPPTEASVADRSTMDAATLVPDAAARVPYRFSGLAPFDAVKGTVTIKAHGELPVSRLELLANSNAVVDVRSAAPFEFSFTTTGYLDGPVRLTLRATTPEGAVINGETLPVMVLNNGDEITFTDAATDQPGNSGTIDVGPTSYEDQHLRYWWPVATDIQRLAVVLFWDDPAFRLELQVGAGQCPEHGPGSIAATASSDSPIYLAAADVDGALIPALPSGSDAGVDASLDAYQYFAHVQLMNAHEVLGKKCPFRLKGFVMREPPAP